MPQGSRGELGERRGNHKQSFVSRNAFLNRLQSQIQCTVRLMGWTGCGSGTWSEVRVCCACLLPCLRTHTLVSSILSSCLAWPLSSLTHATIKYFCPSCIVYCGPAHFCLFAHLLHSVGVTHVSFNLYHYRSSISKSVHCRLLALSCHTSRGSGTLPPPTYSSAAACRVAWSLCRAPTSRPCLYQASTRASGKRSLRPWLLKNRLAAGFHHAVE